VGGGGGGLALKLRQKDMKLLKYSTNLTYRAWTKIKCKILNEKEGNLVNKFKKDDFLKSKNEHFFVAPKYIQATENRVHMSSLFA
jgi:hypothetical protein